VPGRSTLFLAIGLLIIRIFIGLIHYLLVIDTYNIKWMLFKLDLIGAFGYMSSLLWMSVLSFDIFWTFKHFRVSSDDNQRFKFYFLYVFFVLILTLSIVLSAHFFPSSIRKDFTTKFYMLLMVTSFLLSLLFLLLTGIKIFQLSKASNSSEQSRLSEEKDRFWAYVKLFVIISLTWPMETVVYFQIRSHKQLIVPDMIICFSSLLIFTILVLKKNVRDLLKKENERFREVAN